MRVNVQQFAVAAARKQVPHPHALVVAHREQELSIGVEAQVGDPVVVAYEFNEALSVARIPDSNGFVPASAGKEIADLARWNFVCRLLLGALFIFAFLLSLLFGRFSARL